LKMYNGTDAMKKQEDNTVLVKAAWDKIMIEKSCCGVDSKIGDFNESGWYHLTKRRHHFPPACCPPNKDGTLMEFCPTISRYGDVCVSYDLAKSFQLLSIDPFGTAKKTHDVGAAMRKSKNPFRISQHISKLSHGLCVSLHSSRYCRMYDLIVSLHRQQSISERKITFLCIQWIEHMKRLKQEIRPVKVESDS
uniref:Methyltranfer_dom domain-containing protein n=1 Tax=Toxocara canis TaxID=6265 RepID=A0A183V6C4_TOXCA